jgi:hypothetical protein
VQLPNSMRDNMVDALDEYLEAVSASPDTEAIANYVIELLETYAENEGVDDVLASLEEAAALDGTLVETIEEEMSSNDEFEYTGEEIITLLERLCEIEWIESEGDEEEEEEEDEEDDEEENVEDD